MEIFLLKQRENVRERERERGREREWNIVRNRRRGRLRMEPIERTDPRLSYEGNRHGQQPKYHHANWLENARRCWQCCRRRVHVSGKEEQ